jgi:hypothetical protein
MEIEQYDTLHNMDKKSLSIIRNTSGIAAYYMNYLYKRVVAEFFMVGVRKFRKIHDC